MIARFLMDSGDYDVARRRRERRGAEADREAHRRGDAARSMPPNPAELAAAMQGVQTVISALSFHHNPRVAEAALEAGASYFDLTEDVATSDAVAAIAESAADGQIFMPQCGLAPASFRSSPTI